jgi:DnaJ-class molecular chaperone
MSDEYQGGEDGPVADSDDGYKITQAEQEREMCPRCNGSGEGQYEGTKCSRCGGSGELLTEDEEEEKAAKWDRDHDERSEG